MNRADRPAAGENEEMVTRAAASQADLQIPVQCRLDALVQEPWRLTLTTQGDFGDSL